MRALTIGISLLFLSGASPLAARVFPQDTVQAGDGVVDGSRIPAGTVERGWYQLRGGALLRRGGFEVETSRGTLGGEPVLVYRLATAVGGLVDSAWARLDYPGDRASFARRAADDDARLRRDAGHRHDRDRRRGRSRRHRSTHRPFDSSLLNYVIAGLPLADGYRAVIPFYIREQGGWVWHRIATTGPRLVTRPDGVPAEAWRVEVTSDRGSRIVHYIDRETRRTLRTEIGSSVVLLPTAEPPNPRAAAIAREWVAAAIEAMGGEHLGAVEVVRVEQIGYDNALEQSERPEGPWIKIVQEINRPRRGPRRDERSAALRFHLHLRGIRRTRTACSRCATAPDVSGRRCGSARDLESQLEYRAHVCGGRARRSPPATTASVWRAGPKRP